MISEIVVLLALLGFLCIRNEYVRRRAPFVLAILLWIAARVLMEVNYKLQPTGELQYDWGSIVATVAAGCLGACLFCIFLACWRPHRRQQVGETGRPHAEDADRKPPARPEDRIRELVEDVD